MFQQARLKNLNLLLVIKIYFGKISAANYNVIKLQYTLDQSASFYARPFQFGEKNRLTTETV